MSEPQRSIDLNCDLGECEDANQIQTDAELLQIVTSANIACGGHAGDRASMERTVRAAVACGVAVGAHPSYPDRANFGRVPVSMEPDALRESVEEQVRALVEVARAVGVRVTHVKPHGALYHAAMTDRATADAIAQAADAVDSRLVLVGLAGAIGLQWWKECGRGVVAEAFADRRYEPDGSLRPRGKAGAVLATERDACEQAVSIAIRQTAQAESGQSVRVQAQTICIHSDTPGAGKLAQAVRTRLDVAGLRIAAITEAG